MHININRSIITLKSLAYQKQKSKLSNTGKTKAATFLENIFLFLFNLMGIFTAYKKGLLIYC